MVSGCTNALPYIKQGFTTKNELKMNLHNNVISNKFIILLLCRNNTIDSEDSPTDAERVESDSAIILP